MKVVVSLFRWIDSRRSARTTARLLYSDLHRAWGLVNNTLERDRWWDPEFHISSDVWTSRRDTLASALPMEDWLKVAAAFHTMSFLEITKSSGEAMGVSDANFSFAKRAIPRCLDEIELALEALVVNSVPTFRKKVARRFGQSDVGNLQRQRVRVDETST